MGIGKKIFNLSIVSPLVIVNGPWGLIWMVPTTETRWSKRFKADGLRKWTVLKSKNGQSKRQLMFNLKK